MAKLLAEVISTDEGLFGILDEDGNKVKLSAPMPSVHAFNKENYMDLLREHIERNFADYIQVSRLLWRRETNEGVVLDIAYNMYHQRD